MSRTALTTASCLRIAAIGAVVAGALTGCADPGTTAGATTDTTDASAVAQVGAAPATSAATSASAGRPATPQPAAKPVKPAKGDGAILTGRRQINIRVDQDPDGVLGVTAAGRIDLTDTHGDRALFVLVPNGGAYAIKTGTIVEGGEPLCAGLQHNGTKPLTVVTKACDVADPSQRFTIERESAAGYAISSDSAYLQWFRYGKNGLIAQELGDQTLQTTFTFTDRGKATLPILD
jgi:hypothetical protein